MARYPRMPAPPLGAQGQDVRSQRQVEAGVPQSFLESAYLAIYNAGLIAADWSASSPAVGNVAAWIDNIGGLTLAQAVVAKQPIKAATSFSEQHPGVTFDAVDDFLRLASVVGLPVGATPGCMFLVAQKAALADPSTLAGTAFAYGGATAGTYRALGKTGDVARANNGSQSAFDYDGPVWDGAAVVVGEFNPTTIDLMFNGAEIAQAVGVTLNTSSTSITMGASNAASAAEFAPITVTRAMITKALTQLQKDQLQAWLSIEYSLFASLSTDNPYARVAIV